MRKGIIDPFTIIVVALVLTFASVLIYFVGIPLLETEPDCSDVVHEQTNPTTETWYINDADLRPWIKNDINRPTNMWLLYVHHDTAVWTIEVFSSPSTLKDSIDNFSWWTDEERKQAHHIADCIINDCPGCEEI
jgi:hypothetical protein